MGIGNLVYGTGGHLVYGTGGHLVYKYPPYYVYQHFSYTLYGVPGYEATRRMARVDLSPLRYDGSGPNSFFSYTQIYRWDETQWVYELYDGAYKLRGYMTGGSEDVPAYGSLSSFDLYDLTSITDLVVSFANVAY